MKHKAPQMEIPGAAEVFNLAGETIREETPQPKPTTKPDATPSLFGPCPQFRPYRREDGSFTRRCADCGAMESEHETPAAPPEPPAEPAAPPTFTPAMPAQTPEAARRDAIAQRSYESREDWKPVILEYAKAAAQPIAEAIKAEPAPAPKPEPKSYDRDEAIKLIRAALKRRSGKDWSVTGGRGTAWGWIQIDAPPRRATWGCRLKAGAVTDRPEDYEEYDTGEPGHSMSPADRAELGALLGLDGPAHSQGESIPAGSDYRTEYVDRAEGRTPSKIGKPYWD